MLPLPDLAVHPLGDNAALLSYVSLVRHGVSWDRSNRSSVWVRDSGKRLLRFHQGTPAQA
jgi:hypothetical protein